MFLYRPPRLGLTRAEQDVLRAALTGAPDTEIADQLGIPLPGLKARWSRIFERVAASDLGDRLAPPKRNGTRGRQARHVVVEYVRKHPSELTPFDWSSEVSAGRVKRAGA
jgi:DNA-binding NarL/FixJ family response regulator